MTRQQILDQYLILFDRWLAYDKLKDCAPIEYRHIYIKRAKETYQEFYQFRILHYAEL